MFREIMLNEIMFEQAISPPSTTKLNLSEVEYV